MITVHCENWMSSAIGACLLRCWCHCCAVRRWSFCCWSRNTWSRWKTDACLTRCTACATSWRRSSLTLTESTNSACEWYFDTDDDNDDYSVSCIVSDRLQTRPHVNVGQFCLHGPKLWFARFWHTWFCRSRRVSESALAGCVSTHAAQPCWPTAGAMACCQHANRQTEQTDLAYAVQ